VTETLLLKLKVLANKHRLRIIELTSEKEYSITELSSELNLTYTKCADYVTMLYEQGMVSKEKKGKEVMIKSKINLFKTSIF
jgi:predicted transcriptional regulator